MGTAAVQPLGWAGCFSGAESKLLLLAQPSGGGSRLFQETKVNSGEPSCGPTAGLAGAMAQGLRGPAGKPAGSASPRPGLRSVSCVGRALPHQADPPPGDLYAVSCCSVEQCRKEAWEKVDLGLLCPTLRTQAKADSPPLSA